MSGKIKGESMDSCWWGSRMLLRPLSSVDAQTGSLSNRANPHVMHSSFHSCINICTGCSCLCLWAHKQTQMTLPCLHYDEANKEGNRTKAVYLEGKQMLMWFSLVQTARLNSLSLQTPLTGESVRAAETWWGVYWEWPKDTQWNNGVNYQRCMGKTNWKQHKFSNQSVLLC